MASEATPEPSAGTSPSTSLVEEVLEARRKVEASGAKFAFEKVSSKAIGIQHKRCSTCDDAAIDCPLACFPTLDGLLCMQVLTTSDANGSGRIVIPKV